MILTLTLKDTQALEHLTFEEKQEAEKWFKWSEYLTLRLNTETGEAKVIL